jgi:DNA-binding response OmpR family regulator
LKILLVEDDTSLAAGIEFALKAEGYNVNICNTLKSAKDNFNNSIDMILLDVLLPDGTGYEFCQEIRKTSSVPTIFLTACDDEVNVIMGLDIGGDDYITKPFGVRELISTIKAVIRRTSKKENFCGKLISGNINIDILKMEVKKNSTDISLTQMEYKLIVAFMNNPNVLLTRNKLLELLWDVDDNFVDGNTLSVYIRRLREKIEPSSNNPEYILTIRGSGYIWNKNVQKI